MELALSDLKLTSSAVEPHGKIPARHTSDGENVSPPLSWSGAPDGTQSFAVMCHDPDAPLVKPGRYGFAHWVLYDLPASTTELAEDTNEGVAGANETGGTGYTGPAPPSGHGTHHYFFWLLALDDRLGLEPGADLETFLRRAQPHVLGMERLVGTYRID